MPPSDDENGLRSSEVQRTSQMILNTLKDGGA